jgi:hypothetical protein
MQNMADLPNEELRQLVTAARESVRTLTDELAAAHARVTLLQSQLAAAQSIAARGERILAWRERAGSPEGDIETALEELALRIEGGRIHAVSNREGQGTLELVDASDQHWRVTFIGRVESFWLPDYSRISNDQVVGAIIAGAAWDEQWLIEGNLDKADIHVRMFGEPLCVEAMGLGSASGSSISTQRTAP